MFLQILPGGRFLAINATVRGLLQAAYQERIRGYQTIVGGPGWIDSDRFDIEAVAEGDPAPDQIPRLVQALLEDRFALRLRTETRQLPVYALVLVSSNGRAGARLRPSAGDCAPTTLTRGGPPLPATSDRRSPCGLRTPRSGDVIQITGTSVTLDSLVDRLAFYLQREVINRTPLAGTFDLDVEFTRESLRPNPDGDAAVAAPPASAVSIFTALQEQLGLKLDPQRGPVSVLVIDSIRRPTAN